MYYIVGQDVVDDLVKLYPELDFIGIRSPKQKNLGQYCKGNILQLRFDDISFKSFGGFIPAKFSDIDKVVKFSSLESKGLIVHCAAGISRSVAIMIGYLISSGKVEINNVIDVINSIIKNTETLGFRDKCDLIHPNPRIICMFDIYLGLDYKLISSVQNNLNKWESVSTLKDMYNDIWEEYEFEYSNVK